MRCPYCANDEDRVIDSRLGPDGTEIRRRRECEKCGRRFTTRERVEAVIPKIVKRDQRREDFSREKVLGSIELACSKRPVSANAIGGLLDGLERRLQETGEKEVSSHFVGEYVMGRLLEIDPVAASRFASVFEGFKGAEDYARFFSEVEKRKRTTDFDGDA